VKIKCDCGDDYFVDEGDSGWQDWMTCPNCDMPWKYLDRNQWISVKDRLPRDDGIDDVVLVYYDYPGWMTIDRMLWDGKKRKFLKFDIMRMEYVEPDVTHWMPLPKPPEVYQDT